jgi:hypothetical protein
LSRTSWIWSKAAIAIAIGGLIGGAVLWFTFRGGHTGVAVMTGLVIAGALLGIGLGAVVGLRRLRQPQIVSFPSTGDWRDAFRRRR